MTTEQAIQKIESIKSLYKYEIEQAEKKMDTSIKEILGQWLEEHKRFDVGDLVVCDDSIIRIEDVRVEKGFPAKPLLIRYIGLKFELREETLTSCGLRMVFYDDKSLIRFNPLLRKRKQILVKIKN